MRMNCTTRPQQQQMQLPPRPLTKVGQGDVAGLDGIRYWHRAACPQPVPGRCQFRPAQAIALWHTIHGEPRLPIGRNDQADTVEPARRITPV